LSRFIPSAFDFDVITDDTGSRGSRRHRVDPSPLLAPDNAGPAIPGAEPATPEIVPKTGELPG
jgi:hypothetical protein